MFGNTFNITEAQIQRGNLTAMDLCVKNHAGMQLSLNTVDNVSLLSPSTQHSVPTTGSSTPRTGTTYRCMSCPPAGDPRQFQHAYTVISK